jgi:hypothetical protein
VVKNFRGRRATRRSRLPSEHGQHRGVAGRADARDVEGALDRQPRQPSREPALAPAIGVRPRLGKSDFKMTLPPAVVSCAHGRQPVQGAGHRPPVSAVLPAAKMVAPRRFWRLVHRWRDRARGGIALPRASRCFSLFSALPNRRDEPLLRRGLLLGWLAQHLCSELAGTLRLISRQARKSNNITTRRQHACLTYGCANGPNRDRYAGYS